jgi:hypothetical protein
MTESLISGEATEAEAAPPAETQEAPAAETQELLLGKYKSVDDLAEAYKSLESKMGAKEEDYRNKILEELQAEAYKDRPESAGDYKLPDIIDEEASVDSGLLKWWSEHAYENGYSQEEFEQGIEMYAQAVMSSEPDLEAETKKLGDNANTRIEAASAFAVKFFPESALPAIERMCESHEGIIALEHIMSAMKDGSFSGEAQRAEAVNEQKLREMMLDERYHNPVKRDPHFIKQVEDGFRKLYG